MSRMPKLPVEDMCAGLNNCDANLIRKAFNSRTDRLRTSKPYPLIDFNSEGAILFEASANYIWRMLCFDYCGFRPHNCMPITADWDIGAVFHKRTYINNTEKSVRVALDALIKHAESALPITAQKGVMQWGRALEMI